MRRRSSTFIANSLIVSASWNGASMATIRRQSVCRASLRTASTADAMVGRANESPVPREADPDGPLRYAQAERSHAPHDRSADIVLLPKDSRSSSVKGLWIDRTGG